MTLVVPLVSLTFLVIVVNVNMINNTSNPSRKKIIITSMDEYASSLTVSLISEFIFIKLSLMRSLLLLSKIL